MCRTVIGDTAEESARSLAEAGVAAVGVNCGNLDPHESSIIIGIMTDIVSIPIIAQPNAGIPLLVDNEAVFDMKPKDFAEGIAECIAAGATIVGGCCGTTPEHIRCIAGTICKK